VTHSITPNSRVGRRGRALHAQAPGLDDDGRLVLDAVHLAAEQHQLCVILLRARPDSPASARAALASAQPPSRGTEPWVGAKRAAPRRAAVAAPGRARTAAAPRAAAAAAGRQPSALQRSPGPKVRETRPSQRTTRARAASAGPPHGRRCRGRRSRPGGGSGSRRARLLGQRQDEATEAANLAALQPDVVAGRPEADHAAVAGRLHRAQRQALQAHPAHAAARQPPRPPGVSRQALQAHPERHPTMRVVLQRVYEVTGWRAAARRRCVSRAGRAPGPRLPAALRGSRPAQEAPGWTAVSRARLATRLPRTLACRAPPAGRQARRRARAAGRGAHRALHITASGRPVCSTTPRRARPHRSCAGRPTSRSGLSISSVSCAARPRRVDALGGRGQHGAAAKQACEHGPALPVALALASRVRSEDVRAPSASRQHRPRQAQSAWR